MKGLPNKPNKMDKMNRSDGGEKLVNFITGIAMGVIIGLVIACLMM